MQADTTDDNITFLVNEGLEEGLSVEDRRQARTLHRAAHRDADNAIVFKSLQEEDKYEQDVLLRKDDGVEDDEKRKEFPTGSIFDSENDVGYISSLTISETLDLRLPLDLSHRLLPVKFNLVTRVCDIESGHGGGGEDAFSGMPGGLSIAADATNKYFGPHGRSQFFDRLNHVSKQRDLSVHSNDTPLEEVYGDNEKDMKADEGTIPFSSVRSRFSRYTDRPLVTSSGEYSVTNVSLATVPPMPVVDPDDDDDALPVEPPNGHSSSNDRGRKKVPKRLGLGKKVENRNDGSVRVRSSADNGEDDNSDDDLSFFYHHNKKFERKKKKVVTTRDMKRHFLAMENRVVVGAYERAVLTAGDPTKPITTIHKGVDTAADTTSPSRALLSPLSPLPSHSSKVLYQPADRVAATVGSEAPLHTSRGGLHTAPLGYGEDGSDSEGSVSTTQYIAQTLPMHNDRSCNDDDDDGHDVISSKVSMGIPSSPRTQFIDACQRQGLVPRVSLLVRKRLSKKLDLRHQGMQDAMCVLLAQSLPGLPYVESIDVADNNLSDEGLTPLFHAIAATKGIRALDVSQNEIGPLAAAALSRYLSSDMCSLQVLVLSRADVDDFECERFVSVIKENATLTHLDLSYNKIGASENLNTVMPDMITGSEALADLVRSPDCRLKTLVLTYNMIRLDGGAELCASLTSNTSLTYLDLSYNSLADPGGCALGSALEGNRALQHLVVSYNNIGPRACTVICAGVVENKGLLRLVMDGNPLGERGAKALMVPPTILGQRLKISAQKCNITMKDGSAWFESDKPLRDYTLHLDEPYERAVFLLLLVQISAHATYIFKDMTIAEGPRAAKKPLTLSHAVDRSRALTFDHKQKRLRNNLLRIQEAAEDVVKAVSLFQQVDEDGSGELETEEFSVLLKSLGFDFDDDRVSDVMAEYDTDGGGTIGLPEFLNFLKKQVSEVSARIRDLEEVPIFRLKGSKEKYIPPRAGTVAFTVADGFARKKIYRVLSPCDRDYVNEVAMQTTDAVAMMGNAVNSYKVRLDEAVAMGDTLKAAGKAGCGLGEAEILTQLLPQAHSASDARALVKKLIGGSKIELMKLKRNIGGALRPLLGNPDGYYELDLTVEMDKFCLIRLLEISCTFEKARKAASPIAPEVMGDVSQGGNWSCFRNEIFNGEAVELGLPFATPLPKAGLLSFDFISFDRPSTDDLISTDAKVCKMLVTLSLLQPQERAAALSRLDSVRAYQEEMITTKRYYDRHHPLYFEADDRRAREIGLAQSEFYDNIKSRRESCQIFKRREEIKVDFLTEEPGDYSWEVSSVRDVNDVRYNQKHHLRSNTKKRKATTDGDKDDRCAADSEEGADCLETDSLGTNDNISVIAGPEGDIDNGSFARTATVSTVIETGQQMPTGSSRGGSGGGVSIDGSDVLQRKGSASPVPPAASTAERRKAFVKQPAAMGRRQSAAASAMSDYLVKYYRMITSSKVSTEAKGARVAEAIIDMFGQFQIMCRHLQLVLDLFYIYGHKRNSKYFGTYRVEVVCSLYRYVIDLHNFNCVLEVLTPFEAGCLYCRLGWLTLFNPLRPDGAQELDLTRREERIVAKMLCVLATNEPGDSLPAEFLRFRWQRDMDPMPGWELTAPWLTEDGMPCRGLFNATYFTAPRAAMPKLRMGLLKMCFIREEECVLEADRGAASGKTAGLGVATVEDRADLFVLYLAAKPKKKQ